MKKQYIQPEMNLADMDLERMITASVEIEENVTIDPSDADSRLLEILGIPINPIEPG